MIKPEQNIVTLYSHFDLIQKTLNNKERRDLTHAYQMCHTYLLYAIVIPDNFTEHFNDFTA